MTRRSRRRPDPTLEIVTVLFLLGISAIAVIGQSADKFITYTTLSLLSLTVVAFSVAIMIAIARKRARAELLRVNRRLSDIDRMHWKKFEEFVMALMEKRGYRIKDTKWSGDLGVDLIATNRHERIAVQIKHTQKQRTLDRTAVSDAVAGMRHYNCDKSMVIANTYFRKGAKDLAKSNDCILIDRDALAKWLMELED